MSGSKFRPVLLAVALIAILLLLGLCPRPATSQEAPSVRIISLTGFDPTQGKHNPRTRFGWPASQQVAALVRFETSGYSKRKSVEIFWEILNEEGIQLSKHAETRQVHAGKHEAPLPVVFNLDEMFGTRLLTYRVEVKLVGGERLEKFEKFELVGPQLPEITFNDFQITPAADNSGGRLLPGDNFLLRGRLSISGNTSGRLPSLVVWALLGADTLQDEPWHADPFSDLYWDWAQFPAPNGEWQVEINGRLPQHYFPGPATERDFSAFAVVSFGDNRISRTTAAGVVSAVDPETMVSSNLDDRLIRLERNWDWSITPVESPLEAGAEWPQQK